MTELLARVRPLNLSAACFAVSATTLGHALQISSGTFDPDALWWVGVAFVFCLAGTVMHRLSVGWNATGQQLATWVLVSGVYWNLYQ